MTKSFIVNLKPTPIFCQNDFYFCDDKEIEAIKTNKHYKNNTMSGGGDGNYVTIDGNIFISPELENLKNSLVTTFNNFIKNIMGIDTKFGLERSWSTYNTKGSNHEHHRHPNIVWSAVYYVKCNEGAINFDTDNGRTSINEAFNFNYELNHRNVYNSDTWKIPVKTGTLLIFPGHVTHYGDKHLDDSERLLVGTNWFPRGRLYSGESKNEHIEI